MHPVTLFLRRLSEFLREQRILGSFIDPEVLSSFLENLYSSDADRIAWIIADLEASMEGGSSALVAALMKVFVNAEDCVPAWIDDKGSEYYTPPVSSLARAQD